MPHGPLAQPEYPTDGAGSWRGAATAPTLFTSILTADLSRSLLEAESITGVIKAPSLEDFQLFGTRQPALGWIADATGYIYWYNQAWYDYTGTSPEQMNGWGWQSVHDPAVLDAVLERWKRSIATGQPFEMVVPLKGADGVFRPFLTRSVPSYSSDGQLTHWFGNNTEITELVEAEQTRALLISELRHRINNMFSIMQAMISLTARQAKTPEEMAQLLIGRLMAKSKAHDLVRPKSGNDILEIPTTLNELLTVVVKDQALVNRQRVSLEGDTVEISAAAVDHLALIFHELTTNSSKYGALSSESGTMQISWSVQGADLVLTWTEAGGPAIPDAQAQHGFGTRLVELSVMRLGGQWLADWHCTGVRYSFTLPIARIRP